MNQKNNSVTSAETKDELSANVEVSTSSPNNAKPNVGGCGLKPILFSTEMVEAILDGRKSQTRRTKNLKVNNGFEFKEMDESSTNAYATFYDGFFEDENGQPQDECFLSIKCPYKIGQILWVRETWQQRSQQSICMGFEKYYYKAGHFGCGDAGWKPSIFMPYDACRLFLKITNIRVERLQSISEQDAINEGYNSNQPVQDPYLWYRNLWSKINSVENWLSNPFVWVIQFERCVKP